MWQLKGSTDIVLLALFQNGTIILPVFCYCNMPAYRYNVTYGDIMKSILVELTCPRCFYKTHKKSETLIMPEMEPQFRKELLEGVFFKKACPSCGKINTFLHTMIYVDKKHRFVLLVKPKSDLTDKDFLFFSLKKIVSAATFAIRRRSQRKSECWRISWMIGRWSF
ncbi:MAG: CpXC domain-containing protein [[Clostridium] innocuum]